MPQSAFLTQNHYNYKIPKNLAKQGISGQKGVNENYDKSSIYLPRHFLTTVKQHGALLAKGRLLGVQFDILFSDDTYMKLSRNAIATANRLKEIFYEKGYKFYIDSPTNQIFIVLEDSQYERFFNVNAFTMVKKYNPNFCFGLFF